MTVEEFIQILDRKDYSYEIEGDKIVITNKGIVRLNLLESIPPDTKFNNGGNVYLDKLVDLPNGIEFNNDGDVYLSKLETISSGVEFNNELDVFLDSLEAIPPGVKFNNRGYVSCYSLLDYTDLWEGNIEGIKPNSLLNLMINNRMFI